MKTVKIYVSPIGDISLPAADTAAGRDKVGAGITFAVRDVPDDVPDRSVLKLFDLTTIVAPEKRNYTYRYRELGAGRIITA